MKLDFVLIRNLSMTKVQLSDEEISEFKIETEELLEIAEQTLLAIDKGADFSQGYDAIFRAFHSVKGAAGMLNWNELQHHMHQLENHFQICKGAPQLSNSKVSYFLNGIDSCRKLMNGQHIEFVYELPDHATPTIVHTINNDHSNNSLSNHVKNKNEKDESPLIFVIDDEPDIVDILIDMIESAGFRVKGYTVAKNALEDLTKLKPHVVLTDMNMPEMSGAEVLQKVHAIDPDLPVVYVSAHLTKQLLIDALSFGVFSAIEKPFREPQILSVCKNAAKRYELWCLLNRSINFVLYQFSGLEEYLSSKGMFEIKDLMVQEMQKLIDARRQLREEKEKESKSA